MPTVNVAPIITTGGVITLLEDGEHQFLQGDFNFADTNDSSPDNFMNVILYGAGNGTLRLLPSDVVLLPGAVIPVTAINLNQLRYVPNANYRSARHHLQAMRACSCRLAQSFFPGFPKLRHRVIGAQVVGS